MSPSVNGWPFHQNTSASATMIAASTPAAGIQRPSATSRCYPKAMPHRSPGAPKGAKSFLTGKPIRYYRPKGSAAVRTLIDDGFQAFNAARLGEACRIFTDKMLARQHDTTIGLTIAGALTPAGLGGCMIAMMERGL